MSPWLSDLFLRAQTDERLVALAQEGQERAFTAIVDRYRRPLLAHARRLDPGREEDLVQQAFVSALIALRTGTEVRHLRGWLYEILRNLSTHRPRTTSAELHHAEAETESAQQVAERRMLAIDALGALAQLPPRQHHALLQVAIQGRSGSEVAEAMGMTEGAVRQLVHRARASVRAAVTAITPFGCLRWLSTHRSATAARLIDLTLTGGAASAAGTAVKLGVGALMATGVVAGGVLSTGALHQGHGPSGSHPLTAQVTSGGTPRRTDGQHGSAVTLASPVGAPTARHGSRGAVMARTGRRRHAAGPSTGSAGTRGAVPGNGSRASTGAGGPDGGPGPGSGEHPGGNSDSSRGDLGSDGGGERGSSGSDGGGGPQSTTTTTGDGGSDGGSSGSGETAGSGGSDGGSSGSGKSGGSGSDDGGSASGSGSGSTDGRRPTLRGGSDGSDGG